MTRLGRVGNWLKRFSQHPPQFIFASAIFCFVLLVGLLLALIFQADRLSQPELGGNIYYFLFANLEPPIFVLLILSIPVIFWMIRKDWCSFQNFNLPRSMVWWIAGAVFLVTWIGLMTVYHSYPFSMDEYLAVFQAKIFHRGSLFGEIPEKWWSFAQGLTPHFVYLHIQDHRWIANYLPGYAMLRALAQFIQIEAFLNPLLSAGSVLITWQIAKKIWPNEQSQSLICVVLLATSSQFLITGMSFYSMPCHLCLNLLWLYLFLRGGRLGHGLAPWIGIAALNLHQPNVHAMFVIPFLVQMAVSRVWKKIFYYAMIYGLGCLICFWWMDIRKPPTPLRQSAQVISKSIPNHLQNINASTTKSFRDALHLPKLDQFVLQPMNLALFASWQSLALTLFSLLALGSWKKMPQNLKLLGFGICLTFGFYLFFNSTQGHGWGYRYAHAVLGNFVFIAAYGWIELKKLISHRCALMVLCFSTILAVAIQFPVRCFQVERVIRPFAESSKWIQSQKAPFVVVETRWIWYGRDLIRNDPFLENHPKVFWLARMQEGDVERLKKLGDVQFVGYQDFKSFGMWKPYPKQLE
jgi:hypothetical protein